MTKILPEFSDKFGGRHNNEQLIQVTLLYLLSIISSVIILWFAVYNFISKEAGAGFVLFCAIILILINLILSIKEKRYHFGSQVYIIITGLLILYSLLFTQHETNGIWVTFFPLASFLLSPKKHRNLYALVFVFLVAFALFILPVFNVFEYTYNFSHRIIMVVAPVAIHVIMLVLDELQTGVKTNLSNELEKAKNKNIEKDSFLSKLSHQVRTLLNNIVIVSNLLGKTTLNNNQKDLIDTIQASANNLAEAINNISELSKLDVIESIDYHVEFDLVSTISNTLNLFTNQDDDDRLKFKIHTPDDFNPRLKANPIKIKQIFLNLIENLLNNISGKAADIILKIEDVTPEGEDTLSLKFHIQSAQPIHIQYSKAQKQFITSSRNLQDTDLSELVNVLDLAVASRLIEQKEGRLEIKSSPHGSSFQFTYPFLRAEPDKESEPEPIITGRIKSHVAFEDSNILLVEDNLINQKIIILSLNKKVKNIDIANNGKEALDLFGSSKYDLILMDIQMPIMNGLVTAKKIREIEASTNSHTPIIAITANALLGDKENCIAAGMDDYISKPFQIEVLTKKIEEQLAREV